MELLMLIIGFAIGAVMMLLIMKIKGSSHNRDQEKTIDRLTLQLEQSASSEEIIKQAGESLNNQFKAAAAETLQANSQQFLTLSEAKLGTTMAQAKAELDQRHQQFQELVKPLSENYGKLNPQIELLSTQGSSIIEQTAKLASALSDNRATGLWGEVQLRRVVEAAGMSSYCDFTEQASAEGLRPDLLVKLPENRTIIVDAKSTTAAFLEAQTAETEAAADEAWRRHAAALRGQVDNLASKDYGQAFPNALPFAVMFVPGDQFLAAALKENPDLVAYGVSKKVIIATPASLIAVLWAVAHGWQQYQLTADAAAIKTAGDEMHKRLLTFIRAYATVGQNLDKAIDSYNKSIASFDSRLAPQGRKFAQLMTGEAEIIEPQIVEKMSQPSRYKIVEENLKADPAEATAERQLAADD